MGPPLLAEAAQELSVTHLGTGETPSPAPTITIDEIVRGQKGYGISVFAGSRPERFDVEVLGVWRNFQAGSSAILARLSGQGLEDSGVIAGMSGSPVYIDDRLAGAVAFGWAFTNEAIAGITPIDAMRSIALAGPDDPGGPGRLPLTARPGASLHELLVAPNLPEALLEAELRHLAPPSFGQMSSGLLWAAGGFGDESRRWLGTALGPLASLGQASPRSSGIAGLPLGTLAATGSGSGKESAVDLELRPGSPVAAVLVRGDLQLAATGTVTDRFQDDVLAFGHPFLGFGPVSLPMAAAEVLTVISSAANSFKLTNLGPVVGAVEQDRRSAVYGRIGSEAPTVPLTVRMRGAGLAAHQDLSMEVADLPLVQPVLLALSTLGALDNSGHVTGPQGLDLTLNMDLGADGSLTVEQSFDGPNAGTQAALYVLAVSGMVVQGAPDQARAQNVEVELVRSPRERTATLVSAHARSTVVKPGDEVSVFVEMLLQNGERRRKRLVVPIPEDATAGPYYLFVGDGISGDGARLAVEPAVPVSLRQRLDFLRSLHSRRELMVLGMVPAAGLAVDGRVLPQLPPSLRATWTGLGGSSTTPLRLAVADTQIEPLEIPVSGLLRVDLEVRPR